MSLKIDRNQIKLPKLIEDSEINNKFKAWNARTDQFCFQFPFFGLHWDCSALAAPLKSAVRLSAALCTKDLRIVLKKILENFFKFFWFWIGIEVSLEDRIR